MTVLPFGINSMCSTPSMSKNTVAITFPAEGWPMAFFRCGDVVCSHWTDVLFASGVKLWTHVSFPMMIRSRNSLLSTEYRYKNATDDWKRCPLYTSVSRRGTHLWHSLRNPRCSWTMENTLLYEMLSMLAISCSIMRRFSLMISSTRPTFATVLDVAGLPARYSFVRSVCPASNC